MSCRLACLWHEYPDIGYFRQARETWKDYWEWKNNRNEARAKLEEEYGFDCYSADTEFLTENGWKMFDAIGEHEQLATLNPTTHQIEYQEPFERHDAVYTGNMYEINAHHTSIRVSGNHRMYVREYSRNLGKHKQGFSFMQACRLPDSFEIVNRATPKDRQFKNEKPCGVDLRFYLKLMGWYVSEGSVAHRLSNGCPSVLSFSQLKGGRLHWRISRAAHDYKDSGITIREYSHYRKSKDRTEMIWTLAHRGLAKRMVEECGDRSDNKKLPRWVFGLSARMMKILLDALHCGDGTDRVSRGKDSASKYDARRIYYTCSPQLADDVHELAFLAGMESSKWGPYANEGKDMYQIHISASADAYRQLVRHNNVKSEFVEKERIVCFSVPNEILVTRRNGNIAVQGNTKHASHLVRLMRMAEEILRDGKVLVRRSDAQELLAIRNGMFNYDELIEWAEKQDQKLEELYHTSPLPKYPDKEAVDRLLIELRQEHWGGKDLYGGSV